MTSNMTTHINIKHHYYIRELVDAKTIAIMSLGVADMFAGGHTMALPEPKHTAILLRCMGASSDERYHCLHMSLPMI
jgi:hypothetical protein